MSEIILRQRTREEVSAYYIAREIEHFSEMALAREVIEEMVEHVKYIKASHRCICNGDKWSQCSYCAADKALQSEKLKQFREGE